MKRALTVLSISILWGTAAGLIVGAANLRSNHYVRQGLRWLALDVLTQSAWTYLLAGLAGGGVALLLGVATGPIVRRLGKRIRSGAEVCVGLAMFAAASLPVWAWTVLHDSWLYERDRRLMITFFVVLAVVHVPVYFLLVRPKARKEFLERRGAQLMIGAAAGLIVVAVLLAGNTITRRSIGGVKNRPNVIIVVMDTVRADRVSCYGYDRPTTPEVDAFAREGIRFTRFYSTSSWTLPSHASLFTGLHACQHGATQEHLSLGNEFATLVEILRDAGYATWGASGNPLVGRTTNLTQGFDLDDFVDTWRPGARWLYGGEGEVHPNNGAFRRFLEHADRDRPFFAYINYMDAHTPYLPPEPFRSQFLPKDANIGAALKIGRRKWARYYLGGPFPPEEIRTLSDLYDGEVAGVDYYVGDLLETLRKDGRHDDTLIIITSDHGEHHGENGLIEHVFGLYNTTVKVPLLVRLPGGGRAGETNASEGQILDLFPTVLAACGVSDDAFAHHGHDLLSDARGGEDEREGIFAEYYWPVQVLSNFTRKDLDANIGRLTPYLHRMRAFQRDGYRLIWSSRGHHRFYNLDDDPGETRNLFDPENPHPLFDAYLDQLETAVDIYSGGTEPGPEPNLDSMVPGILRTADPEAIDALRVLGYVD